MNKMPARAPLAAPERAPPRRLLTPAHFLRAVAVALAIGAAATSASAESPASVTPVSGIDLNQSGISGAWYDPASSGQGFVISVMPNVDGQGHAGYFGGWFTFADHWSGEYYRQALGTPMWLTLQGDTSFVDPNVGVRLAIYDNDGRDGNFAAPPAVKANQLGWAYLSMSDCNHMHLHYTVEWRADFVDPQWQEMDLKRLMPNVSCTDANTQPPPASAGAGFSAAWYDPATSGQGLAFEINPNVQNAQGAQGLFGGWFTYAADSVGENLKGRRWYTLQGSVYWAQLELLAPDFLVGNDIGIYETTGGTFATPNSPATVIRTQRVGTAIVKFGTQYGSNVYLFSCANAYLAYNFDSGENAGRRGEIALQRLGPTPSTCGPQGQ